MEQGKVATEKNELSGFSRDGSAPENHQTSFFTVEKIARSSFLSGSYNSPHLLNTLNAKYYKIQEIDIIFIRTRSVSVLFSYILILCHIVGPPILLNKSNR